MDIAEAENGKDALQKVESLRPHLIFMDIKLPGENGLELTKKIKARYSDISIIILTSYDLPEYREAAREYQADHFLSKGASTKEDILTLVQSIITERDIDS
jgi:YesN/AraC family two-component response regulator